MPTLISSQAANRGAKDMPVVIISVLTSVLLIGLIGLFPSRPNDPSADNARSEFNADVLRQMAARGAKVPTPMHPGNKIIEAGYASALNRGSLN